MSKNNPKNQAKPNTPAPAVFSHEAEYRIIKVDLVKVLILNLIYLGAVLALYYSNKESHFLEAWFAKLFNF